jgi:anti-sigma factor RsiW
MIDLDSQLKLQAYLDDELSNAEAAEVKRWLAEEPEAQALLDELRNTKSALVGYEATFKLPESREFFWSKIEREIERQTEAPAPAPNTSWLYRLRHHFLPLSGVALLTLFLGGLFVESGRPAGQFGEMEMASDQMGSYTFRDQKENVTMVWLYNHGDDSEFTKAASLVSVEPE